MFTDDGGCFSAVWGSSFDHYRLEVFPEPMTAQLRMIHDVMVVFTAEFAAKVGIPSVG